MVINTINVDPKPIKNRPNYLLGYKIIQYQIPKHPALTFVHIFEAICSGWKFFARLWGLWSTKKYGVPKFCFPRGYAKTAKKLLNIAKIKK